MSKRERNILEVAKHARTMPSRGLEEREIEYKGVKYILNNNSGKYSRIFRPEWAGPNSTVEQVMAFYDHFEGLILLAENRAIIPKGFFWPPYEAKLRRREERKKYFENIKSFLKHPLVVTLLAAVIFYIIYLLSGIDLNNLSDETSP